MTTRAILGGLLTAALLACAAPPLPEQAPLSVAPLALRPGEQIGIDRVALVTDASGTMYNRKTFPEAKALTRSFVAGMPDGRFGAGLLSFGGEDRIREPVAPLDRSRLAATAAALRILGDIDGRGGHTPFHRVFQELESDFPAPARLPGAVVVFSDGLPDRPAWALEAARDLSEARGGQLCFHAVQTGDDPAGTAYLTSLAALTRCGTYRTAASVRDPQALMGFEREVFRITRRPTQAEPDVPDDPCGDIVRLRGIQFDFDRAAIRPDSAVVLDAAVDRLRQCPDLDVRIDGHTCWIGTETYNQGLSERRAESVRRYFVERGIAPSRLSTRGLGESDPIASNQTREGRARNRRVELHPR